jgi:uncharacterized protein (TIGR02677 family)
MTDLQPERFKPFAHLQGSKADLYRSMMAVFVRQKSVYAVHLRPDDVLVDLVHAPDPDELTAALKQLVEWGNLRADPDTSRVTTVEDFHRARFLYQLTHVGEAVETALAAYDDALGRRGELQAVALEDIEAGLRELLTQAGQDGPDPAKVHLALRHLTDRFAGLADNAAAFMASLQRTIDLHDVDVDTFLAYKDRLIDYLQRFVEDLVVRSPEILRLLDQLQETGIERLLAIAAAREAADAAPDAVGAEAPGREVEEAGRIEWQARWAGLRSWFAGTPERPSQSTLLRQRARSAVPALLAVVAALHDRRTRRSDRSADFRTLARWFAEAPDTERCHRLWRSAFGLSPARHLAIDATTLEAWRDDPVAAATPWADAPPIVVNPRLRRTGSFERRGRASPVEDRAAGRAALQRYVEAERTQVEEARRRLATGLPTRLSHLAELDRHEFALFLSLLAEALSARHTRRGPVSTTTADGSMLVKLEPTGEGHQAEITTPGGVFRGPDHLLTIVDLVEAREEAAS